MANTTGKKFGGRRPGAPNKTTKTVRTWLTELIDKNRSRIEKDIKALEPKDRLLILEKLMSYTIPKMSSTQISIDQLSDNQLDQLIDEITQNINSDEVEN